MCAVPDGYTEGDWCGSLEGDKVFITHYDPLTEIVEEMTIPQGFATRLFLFMLKKTRSQRQAKKHLASFVDPGMS